MTLVLGTPVGAGIALPPLSCSSSFTLVLATVPLALEVDPAAAGAPAPLPEAAELVALAAVLVTREREILTLVTPDSPSSFSLFCCT